MNIHFKPFRRQGNRRHVRRLQWAGLACAAGLTFTVKAAGQTRPAVERGLVVLPTFEVRDQRAQAYGASEAISTTRISIPIQDIAQTVSVVTRELIDDTHGMRMSDVAKFVTPLVEGIKAAGDNYSVRGFRVQRRFIDGVNIGDVANSMWSDMSNVERLEITKGPNAILVPGGAPGGIINQITKSPRFEDFTRLALNARTYLGSEASLDANRMFGGQRSAARLVATLWDSGGYFDGQFRRGWLVAPSFTHRFASGAELVVKLETLENRESNGMGVEIDPAAGTRAGGYARKHPLLPRDNLFPPADGHSYRGETRVSSDLRLKVAGNVAVRLWLLADHVYYSTPATSGAFAGGQQGGRNPLTGEWEPFKLFAYNAITGTVIVTDLTPSTSTLFLRRNQQLFQLEFTEICLKNDYAGEYRLGPSVRGTTVAGLNARGQFGVKSRNWRITRSPLDYATGRPVGPDEPHLEILAREKEARLTAGQAFLYQRLHFFSDRVIISGGGALSIGVLERTDDGNLPPTRLRTTRNRGTDANFGAVWKPVPAIAFFTGYNRVGGVLPVSSTAGEYATGEFKVGIGNQWEYGVKTSWLKQRITTSAAFFEITESNSQVTNPAFQANPFTEPAFLYVDQQSRGWEIEIAAQLTRELELVGNYTQMRMRDFAGIPQAMVPDHAGALFAKYTVRDGRGKGLGLSFGLHYLDKLPGDNATGVTLAGVRNQPSFYLAPRTILQAGASYRRERWSLGLMVQNLTNKDYIQASSGRNLLPGEPRNCSVTLEVKW